MRTLSRKRTLVALGVLAAAVVALLAVVWPLVRAGSNVRPSAKTAAAVRAVLSPPSEVATVAPPPSPAAEPPSYVLVMGTEDGRTLSTLLLARIERCEDGASVLWIPPKASLAEDDAPSVSDEHARGGPASAIAAVKRLTGLPVHHYVSFEIGGLARVVDTMGGVVVEEKGAVDIGSQAATGSSLVGGRRLSGDQVLGYVLASRGAGASGPEGRAVADAVLSRAREKLASPSGLGLLLRASRHVETDMTPGDLARLGERLRTAASGELPQFSLRGRARGGAMYLWPASGRVQRTVRDFASGSPPGD